MSKKKKVIIDIIFYVVMFLLSILEYISSDFIEQAKNLYEKISLFVFFFPIFAFFAAFRYFPIPILYTLIRFRPKRYQIDKTDIKKHDGYNREITNLYSPGVLSYIDNFEININTAIATLMYLELKGLIKVKDEITLTGKNPSNLDKNSNYIYKLSKESNLKSFNLYKYIVLIEKDCIKRGLLLQHPVAKMKSYSRSELAQSLNKDIDGLKNFFKDFSNLDDKTKKDLVLWEEHLMYSVLFDHNVSVKKEYIKFFKK